MKLLFLVAVNRGTGDSRRNLGNSVMGMDIEVKSSYWMRYDYCSMGWEESRGMSITVPEWSERVAGSS